MEDNKKKGLGMVLEGGGMRGLYTAGVLDELMEQGIYADSTVGVSAGAIFGCNYKSRQIGRTLRYNTRFCKDKRYMGLKSWITTGDLYSKDFAYGEVPCKLDVFDTETFARSPMYAQILKQGNPAIRNAEWETGWMWNGCAHQLPCHWPPDR